MLRFSIIIPVKSINEYVRETVNYIQKLSGHEWELFIVTNEAEKSEWPNDLRVSVHSSGRVGPADKRDLGAGKAKGDILVFLDDDSYPNSNLLEVASQYFENPKVAAVGGPGITPPSDSFWQKVSGAAFLSRFTGGAPERYASIGTTRPIYDWPSVNLMVRRDVFLSVGGFDCNYWPGEDTKLCLNLKQIGKEVFYAPEMIVWHHRRGSLVLHLRQVCAYGLHRGYFARRYPETSLRLKYFFPSIFTLFVLVTISSPWVPDFALRFLIGGWVVYGCTLLVGMFETLKFERMLVAVTSLLFYVPLSHFVYGIQFVRGYARQRELISKLH